MKILAKTKFGQPVEIRPTDSVHLIWHEQTVLVQEMDRFITITGAVIFEIEPGDIPGVKDGVGGAFIEEVE